MKRLPFLGFAAAAVVGLCGFLLQGPTSAPPPPGIPAPAAAAGFTTTFVQADFTTTSAPNSIIGGAPATTVQWGTLSNWLQECGAGNPSIPGWHWQNGSCSDVDLEIDQSINKTVLHLRNIPNTISYWLSFPFQPFGPGTGFGSQILPLQYFWQATFRIGSGGANGNHIDIFGSWLSSGGGNGYNGQWVILEPDNLEVYSTPGAVPPMPWGDGSSEYYCNPDPPGFCNTLLDGVVGNTQTDVTQYHTYGALFTSDSVGQYWKCTYLDTNLQGCDRFPVGPDGNTFQPTEYNKDHVLVHMIGDTVSSNQVDVYFKDIGMWACPNSYLTPNTQCPGPINNSPPH